MKERPVNMTAEEVRAILDGRKTQTRQVVKGAEKETWQGGECGIMDPCTYWNIGGRAHRCPYGQPGDRLWVRESYHMRTPCHDGDMDSAEYRADYCDELASGIRWRPSIHMPRSLSRITLEVVSVRVERLQDISEEDAKAEGVIESYRPVIDPMGLANNYFVEFTRVWQSIHGPDSWAENPWVWVVEFRRLEGAK